jgi:hypothetical protein
MERGSQLRSLVTQSEQIREQVAAVYNIVNQLPRKLGYFFSGGPPEDHVGLTTALVKYSCSHMTSAARSKLGTPQTFRETDGKGYNGGLGIKFRDAPEEQRVQKAIL